MIYRNVKTGQEVHRPHGPDEWLEASSGWEPVAQGDNEPTPVGDEKESI